VTLDINGTVVGQQSHLPFGEEIPPDLGQRSAIQGYASPSGIAQKYTQKQRDIESGLDYFGARYYSSAQGRFTSPDEFTGGPVEFWVLGSGDSRRQALPYADITTPQSLNKYHYGLNNPLRYVDPDGHQERAEQLLDHDVKDLLEGRITQEQYMQRLQARAVGAAIGVGFWAAVWGGPYTMAAGRAMFLWAAVNPDKVQEIAAAIQESAGGPPGAVTGAIGGATKAELSIARKLAAEGKKLPLSVYSLVPIFEMTRK